MSFEFQIEMRGVESLLKGYCMFNMYFKHKYIDEYIRSAKVQDGMEVI